jgi:sugar (pentulose or hexulose) kinase
MAFVDPESMSYDKGCCAAWNALSGIDRRLESLLPKFYRAGDGCGRLNLFGSHLLDVPEGTAVSRPEGDQPAAAASCFITEPGFIGASLGTSVVANVIIALWLKTIYPMIDHFRGVYGEKIAMGWLKNGTTPLNMVIRMLMRAAGMEIRKDDLGPGFQRFMPEARKTKGYDCGGLRLMPFLLPEPAAELPEKAVASWIGLTDSNLTPANMINASVLAVLFNLRISLDALRKEGVRLQEFVLTGGLARDHEHFGPMIANVLDIPVRVMPKIANEGTAYGAGVIALYEIALEQDKDLTWQEFLQRMKAKQRSHVYKPDRRRAEAARLYREHLELLSEVARPMSRVSFLTA